MSADELEPGPDAMRAMLAAVTARIVGYIEALPGQAGYVDGGPRLAERLAEPLPEEGTALAPLLDLVFDELVPTGVNTAGHGCLSYVNSGGLFHAALADAITAATNRYVGYWAAGPGLVELELRVLRWFCDVMGLPKEAGGVLLTGGSTATVTAMVTAREALLGGLIARGVVYVSDQGHHSVAKAAMIAGIPRGNVRTIPTDDRYRLRVDALEAQIRADVAAGLTPFFVAGTAGTTNTGAVDDLPALRAVAERHDLWFHVDASYGGFFAMTQRGKAALRGVELADSLSLDPHKSLFLPYGSGCLLVKDPEMLRRANAIHSEYVSSITEDRERVNFADLSIEQTRDARGLRVWLPLKLLGAAAFRRALDEKLDLAEYAARQLEAIEGIEILAEPQLSILAFRLLQPGLDEEALTALNQGVLDAVNQLGRVHLSSTVLRGRYAIRVCVLSVRVHRDAIDRCVEDVRTAVLAARVAMCPTVALART